ncbi:MAG: hypothetical protein MK082_01915 [Phycisphaerales bacterium]|nr:hypothetical protein [Phycisphaerales bacterium]
MMIPPKALPMHRIVRLGSCALVVFGSSLFCGCRMTVLEPTADDDVRQRIAAVEEENRDLRMENEGLKTELAAASDDFTPDEEVLRAAMPRLAAMEISSSSVVEAPEGGARTLVLRLDPSDDRGRFLQVVGSLKVRAVAVPTDAEPRTLAFSQFSPTQIRDAWRGGVFGTGYVLDIPLTQATHEPLPDTIDVVTTFRDATSGREFRDEKPVRVSRAGI